MRDSPVVFTLSLSLYQELIWLNQLWIGASTCVTQDASEPNLVDEKLTDQLPSSVGIDDFRTLRLDDSVYVDKSEMITEYLDRGGIVLIITKPKKWGKSINISMFKYFFDIELDENGVAVSDENKQNSVLFTGGNVKLPSGKVRNLRALKISQYESAMDHQGNNPVVLLSFKEINGNSFEDFKSSVKSKIRQLFKTYPYLNRYMRNISQLDLGDQDKFDVLDKIKLENSLYYLSKILFRHFKRNVYIFIDDFDVPIVNAFLAFGRKSNEFKDVLNFIYKLMKKTFKDNYFLERGVLVGTFHFGWFNEILQLSSVHHSTFIDTTFSRFYGFTSEEVNHLLKTFSINTSLDKINEWYGGYNFESEVMYNPWSTLNCLENKGKLEKYWNSAISSNNKFVDQVFLMDGAQEYLQTLLQGKIILRKDINKPINLETIENTFHRTLLFCGYFHSVSSTCDARCYIHPWNLSLPNREVTEMVSEGMSKWVSKKLNISLNEYFNLTNLLTTIQIDSFKSEFQRYLVNAGVSKTSDYQQQYHLLVGGLLSSLASRFTVQSQRKQGQRSREYMLVTIQDLGHDMVFVEYEISKGPKNLQVIVESGLNRMEKKQYIANMTNYKFVTRIIKIYLGISRKKISAKYMVENI